MTGALSKLKGVLKPRSSQDDEPASRRHTSTTSISRRSSSAAVDAWEPNAAMTPAPMPAAGMHTAPQGSDSTTDEVCQGPLALGDTLFASTTAQHQDNPEQLQTTYTATPHQAAGRSPGRLHFDSLGRPITLRPLLLTPAPVPQYQGPVPESVIMEAAQSRSPCCASGTQPAGGARPSPDATCNSQPAEAQQACPAELHASSPSAVPAYPSIPSSAARPGYSLPASPIHPGVWQQQPTAGTPDTTVRLLRFEGSSAARVREPSPCFHACCNFSHWSCSI
jgi:hypothetical protein